MRIVIEIDTGLTGTDHALRALRAMSDTTAGPAEVILDSGQHTFVVTEIVGVARPLGPQGLTHDIIPLEEA